MSEVIVALDGMTPARALALAETLSPLRSQGLWGFKIGHEMANQGAEWVSALKKHGHVFVDLKLHDIPNTVEHAVRWLATWEIDLATVHISMGRETLNRVAELGVGILGVSLLTSTLPEACLRIYGASPQDTLQTMFREVLETQIRGVVCAPQDLEMLDAFDAERRFTRVCPGIRRAEDERGDQQRTATPQFAQERGADLLVIGRPIVQQEHPVRAATSILSELRATT
jgi:orotidine-5'-phosphate decarboxylase